MPRNRQKQDNSEPVDYTGFIQDPIRISHAVDTISIPPSKEELEDMFPRQRRELVREEIRMRKRIMSGLAIEIQELERFL